MLDATVQARQGPLSGEDVLELLSDKNSESMTSRMQFTAPGTGCGTVTTTRPRLTRAEHGPVSARGFLAHGGATDNEQTAHGGFMVLTPTEYFNRYRTITGAAADDRFTSFDYCFNHFQSLRRAGELDRLRTGEGLETGCLHLGFYLASWGMYRGSSKLLSRSAHYLVRMVRAVADAEPELWAIDVNTYSDENIARLIDFREVVRHSFDHELSATLITKMMLGIFGNVPALDTVFQRGTGRRSFDEPTLKWVKAFYDIHRTEIDRLRPKTLDFNSGRPTGRLYTRAKVIDRIGFAAGRCGERIFI